MKKLIILALTSLVIITAAKAAPDKKPTTRKQKEYSEKLLKLVKNVTDQSDIKKLTENDIPAEWKTKVKTSEDKDFHKKIYNRGKDTTLEVAWMKKSSKLQTERTIGHYHITIIHKGNKVVTVTNFKDSISVMPRSQKYGYTVNTHLEKNKDLSLVILSKDGWIEALEIKGIHTQLMDDLKYTKQTLLTGRVSELIEHAVHKKPKTK